MADMECYCCRRKIKAGAWRIADTQDGQIVFVGEDCYKRIAATGNEGLSLDPSIPNMVRLYAPVFDVRWVVEYESSGVGTQQSKEFDAPSKALRFARKVTTDGTAFPSVAGVTLEKRENRFYQWQRDQRFFPTVEVIDGACQE